MLPLKGNYDPKLYKIYFNPNRSLDTPCLFLIGKMRLSGILPASVRILFLATPRRSPLRLRLGPKSNDRFGFKDTGLLIASLDEEAQEDLRANKNLGTYKGVIYENT